MKLRINVTVHIVWYMSSPKRSSGFNPDKIWIQMIVEGDYKQIPILFTKIRLAPNLEFPEVRESSKAAAIRTGRLVHTV